ncbi:MAG: hypothetical protein J5895_03195 [Alphaproteobacteria bacterium]|nr:hypothetical protein [Alphaproteobacteria bacterium]
MERVFYVLIVAAGFFLVAVDSPNFRLNGYSTQQNPLYAVEVTDDALEAIRKHLKRNLFFRF